jgi:hypothetical protein
MEELIAEEFRHIKEALSLNLPSVRVDEVAQPLGYGATNTNLDEVDFNVLVHMRRQHHTPQWVYGQKAPVRSNYRMLRKISHFADKLSGAFTRS